jgi:hypothetical protein
MMKAARPPRSKKDEAMLLKTLLGSLVVAPFILAGCVTAGKREPNESGADAIAKEGSKAEPGAAGDGKPKLEAEPVGIAGTPSEADQLAFVQRHSSPASAFGEKDHQLLAALAGKPEPGSVAEAALAVGLVKAVNNPLDTAKPSFDEQDLGGGAAKSSAASLESRCRERGLDLPGALAGNPLLATHGFAKQVVEELGRHRVSDDFKVDIQNALKRNAESWASLSGELGAAAPGSEPPPPPEDAPAPVISDDAPLNPADLKGVDSALAEAEALADRGDYKAAIKKAKTLPPSSPMRSTAQEKVKEFSNRGVQDLRRKAADAFQNARPVSDPKARASYLQQAKGYLEEALKDYPDATLLPTVRDNLRMITRDLEQLTGEKR